MAIVGTVASGPSTSLTLDLQSLNSRVASLLRRSDLGAEIDQWLNFVHRDITNWLDLPALRVGVNSQLLAMPVAPVSSPTNYYYLDLPVDFSHIDRVFYRNKTDTNNTWGRNLVPLPREFYAGDTVDLERLMSISTPSVGDPQYYWLETQRLGFYPAMAFGLSGEIDLWYYRLPVDLIYPDQKPEIPNQYRHYLIWMTLYWGKALLAQASDELPVVAYWEKVYEETKLKLKRMNRKQEHPVEAISRPETGMEQANEVY